MAPEYIMHGQFSVKSDVFSFGVLVLEIVSGQKNHGVRHEKNGEDLLSFVSVTFLNTKKLMRNSNLLIASEKIVAGMEKLERGDSYKYYRSSIEEQFTK